MKKVSNFFFGHERLRARGSGRCHFILNGCISLFLGLFLSSSFLLIECAFNQSHACRITTPLTKELEDSAETVFRGKLISYQFITAPPLSKGQVPFTYAKLRFKTLSTVRGENKKEWELIWLGGNLGVLTSQTEFVKQFSETVEVGITSKGSASGDIYKDLYPKFYASLNKLPGVVQSPCSVPYFKKLVSPA